MGDEQTGVGSAAGVGAGGNTLPAMVPTDGPPPPVTKTHGEDALCPHCEYSLAGLSRETRACPECGGSLSAAAYAMAAARRVATSVRARLVLFASPAVGIFGGVLLMRLWFGLVQVLAWMFVCLWAGGATAVWFSMERRRRSAWRAVLLGLPLGVVYFAVVCGIALGVVFGVVRLWR